ncbi:MAG: neuraminidase-like domain-containing protein [Cytophagales bacterium]|nr:neuraminidase-like domain-containing protein [Cytophagales bacterium]
MDFSFNLWQEEARTYLNFLRVPRHELMAAFQTSGAAGDPVPGNFAIASEYFGISSHEAAIISNETEAGEIKQNQYWNLDTGLSEAAVDTFLKRSKLSYEELLQLLMVHFVNGPDSGSRSIIERPSDTCALSVQQITKLSPERYDKMHRFLRLWRTTPWEMWELDLLIRNSLIGNGSISETTLVRLMRFHQLQKRLKLSPETLLVFFGDINTETRVSPYSSQVTIPNLYDQLFRNPSITNPLDTYFETVPLDSGIKLESNSQAPYSGYSPVPTILSALAISSSDFDELKALTNNQLSVDSLSILMRHSSLAKKLKISVTELLAFMEITGVSDPFASVQDTLDFIEKIDLADASDFSYLELQFLLNHEPDSPYGLREETIEQYLEGFRSVLVQSKEESEALGLEGSLAEALDDFDEDGLEGMTSEQIEIALQPLQSELESYQTAFTENNFSIEALEGILFYDTEEGQVDLLIAYIKDLKENMAALLEQHSNQVYSYIAGIFGFEDQVSRTLLNEISLPGESLSLSQQLSDGSLLETDGDGEYLAINSGSFPEYFKLMNLLSKLSLLVTKLPFDSESLSWFIENHAGMNSLDLSALPVETTAQNYFSEWSNTFRLLRFKEAYPEPEGASVLSVWETAMDDSASKQDILDGLSAFAQWDLEELQAVDALIGFQHTEANLDYTDPETYERLQECFSQSNLTGVSMETMGLWADREDLSLQEDTAQQCRLAIKSKYEESEWLDKIRPLTDEIREKKRKALVAYHLENSMRTQAETVTFKGETIPNPLYWKDTAALYKYLLIDVEMSACQLTSRIKQAISSVQLFVQRCFLNLENRYVQVSQEDKADDSSENAWSQWKWMKTYRIWEANRKVFFYPENWIEPDLRDDKTPFFKEMEEELMQNELTHEHAESAFLSYLNKLDETARLEVSGIYHERDDLNEEEDIYTTDILHVVARTPADPSIYYYRNYDLNYSVWSAWEKIDLEIQGEQLLPVVYNRKLHLFWLIIVEKPLKLKNLPPSNSDDTATEPTKMLEIQLAWAVKQEGGWSSRKLSKGKLLHPWERPLYTYNLKPYYYASTNELGLDVYLSTAPEFNDKIFYDPYTFKETRLCYNQYNETYHPWHSSMFLFDGQVKDLYLRGLVGSYHIETSSNPSNLTYTDSFAYVSKSFGEEGRNIKKLTHNKTGPRLNLPYGMHFHNTHLTNNRKFAENAKYLRGLNELGSTLTFLSRAKNPFKLTVSLQDRQITDEHPMFYQDNERVFFINPFLEHRLDMYGQIVGSRKKYSFEPFYHPYTDLFIRELNRDGIDGLLRRKVQTEPHMFVPKNYFLFQSEYQPNDSIVSVHEEAERERLDFSFGGAYSVYNWEVFFHAPLLIATQLSQNQRFEEAMRWFHYIFDPTNIEELPTPQRYWVTKPFYEHTSEDYRKQRIENILSNIQLSEHQEQLKAWRNNPFNPHLIARYRPVAYQRNVLMKYLDNLIDWGDQLFRRDSIESINEASLLYMLAYEILGDRPQEVPNVDREELSFNELKDKLDDFGNARVDVILEDSLSPIKVVPSASSEEPLPQIDTFYFCIPNNSNLLEYWATVEDRLFKIRNCMNIEGVVRQLPLFQPPIDPALLVKATAAGIDLSSVLSDLSAGTPYYRFQVVVQKAVSFTQEVSNLGSKLLSVLEKKDSAELELLYAEHESQIQEAMKDVHEKEVDESAEVLDSLQRALEIAQSRQSYYDQIPRMNGLEIAGAVAHGVGIGLETAGTIVNIFGSSISLVPLFDSGATGLTGTPTVKLKFGGKNMGDAASKTAEALKGFASVAHASASLMEAQGSFSRRDDDNKHQAEIAGLDIERIEFDINAGLIRQQMAEKRLENQELRIEQAQLAEDYLKNKYTNEQLYNWMIQQISSLYFQSYQLAYDMAKKAEKCFQYELGISDSSYIQFGYWDSLKKGLLSGDKLAHDLRRLESAYIDRHRRELELTKHISLAQFAPESLIRLKTTGECLISLPEWLFNMDHSGHYMRRIKSVSVSIPCITGPYTSVNCSLTLSKSEIRTTASLSGGGNYAKEDAEDTRFQTRLGALTSIATSHAQTDPGLFELNFRDDRYLPFEGAGVISDWKISLPLENNAFDFNSISDVILHFNYTARDGGSTLAVPALEELQSLIPESSVKLLSLKHDFPNSWHQLFYPSGDNDQEFSASITEDHYPFILRGQSSALKIKYMDIFLLSNEESDFELQLQMTSTEYEETTTDASPGADYSDVHHTTRDYGAGIKPDALGDLKFKLRLKGTGDFSSLTSEQLDNVFILCQTGL